MCSWPLSSCGCGSKGIPCRNTPSNHKSSHNPGDQDNQRAPPKLTPTPTFSTFQQLNSKFPHCARCVFALRDRKLCVLRIGIRYRSRPPNKGSMSSPGDWREESSTDEEVQPPRLRNRAAQVSCLPFSVDALMSDRRPPSATDRKLRIYSVADQQAHKTDGLTKQLVSIKTEPVEGADCASWIPRNVMMTTPTSKWSRVMSAKDVMVYIIIRRTLMAGTFEERYTGVQQIFKLYRFSLFFFLWMPKRQNNKQFDKIVNYKATTCRSMTVQGCTQRSFSYIFFYNFNLFYRWLIGYVVLKQIRKFWPK